jgi:DNA ligase-1
MSALRPSDSSSSFLDFAQTCEAIAGNSSKLEKVRLLAEYMRRLQPEAMALAATWFSGRPFPPNQNKVLQLGWAVLRDAMCVAGGTDEQALRGIYLRHSDVGETAFELLKPLETSPSLSLEQVDELFQKLHASRGPLAKTPLLTGALERCSAIEAKYLVKTITGDLRIGLKEGLVEDAVASAFGKSGEEVRQANLLLGDIGETAKLAAQNRLAEAALVPFRPIKFMLASPEETAAAVWERVRGSGTGARTILSAATTEDPQSTSLSNRSPPFDPSKLPPSGSETSGVRRLSGAAADAPVEAEAPTQGVEGKGSDSSVVSRPSGVAANKTVRTPSAAPVGEPVAAVWLEDKYDGIRCQLHKVEQRVGLYSRDLKEISSTFLELADSVRNLPADFVLDGEIVAVAGDEVLPFAELQKRLGRRQGDLFMRDEVPIKLVAFDLLWLDGQSFLQRPLRERRQALEALSLPPAQVRLAQVTEARAVDEIEAAFGASRARGNEGLMIKDPASVYMPGRRGLAWLKLKKAFATLDCVVVGAEYGHGKRNKVLSDYTFAVRDEQTNRLKTIGKAYTGLTDAEIAQLTEHFLQKALRRHGRYFEVEPDTVLEIAFDRIQHSNRHESGLAMRFPRIVRIRTDKAVSEIDTLATARKLVSSKQPLMDTDEH